MKKESTFRMAEGQVHVTVVIIVANSETHTVDGVVRSGLDRNIRPDPSACTVRTVIAPEDIRPSRSNDIARNVEIEVVVVIHIKEACRERMRQIESAAGQRMVGAKVNRHVGERSIPVVMEEMVA